MPEETSTSIGQPHCLDCKTLFIPDEKLGALFDVMMQLPAAKTKRLRKIEFNHLEQVLKGLKLISRSCKVVGISYGCLDTGDQGAFILFKEDQAHVTQAIVSLPEAPKGATHVG